MFVRKIRVHEIDTWKASLWYIGHFAQYTWDVKEKKEIDEISEFLKAYYFQRFFGDFQDNLSGSCDQK